MKAKTLWLALTLISGCAAPGMYRVKFLDATEETAKMWVCIKGDKKGQLDCVDLHAVMEAAAEESGSLGETHEL